jgi:hypothetical protein
MARYHGCQLLQLKEASLPDGVTEVIAFAKERLTQREQWGYLRLCIEYELQYGTLRSFVNSAVAE